MKSSFTIALCQTRVVDDKHKNINNAVARIEEAAQNGAELVALPEIFNCPYQKELFADYAESIDSGETIKRISDTAKKLGTYIVAGSIPETDEGKIYNTSITFDNKGRIIAKYRKVHLFNIDIPGKIVFKESEVLSQGNDITVINTELCKIGIAICYDIRFPEQMRLLALSGAELIVIPAAFNMITGQAHWELLIRTRAIDNQVYVAAVSPARNENAAYIAYGNSMVADPWGNVIAKADEKEGIIYALIDLDIVKKTRTELPLLKHRRNDVYKLMTK
ncbi:MAG: carbon-nitrogen hydrolase family protein [Acetivibrionales bacterium]|jgi:omega-amidase